MPTSKNLVILSMMLICFLVTFTTTTTIVAAAAEETESQQPKPAADRSFSIQDLLRIYLMAGMEERQQQQQQQAEHAAEPNETTQFVEVFRLPKKTTDKGKDTEEEDQNEPLGLLPFY